MNIGISGPAGAGKTTAAKYLASKHGLSYLRYSEILAEMLERTDPDRGILRKFGWDIMSEGLQLSLNRKLLSKMELGINYVVDGLRHPIDFETLSSRPPFYLLYIDAGPAMRWQRLSSRDEPVTWEEFQEAENLPTESHLPTLKEKAYKVLQNDGSIAELYADLDSVLKELRGLGKQ